MEQRRARIWSAQRAGLVARLRDALRLSDDRIDALLRSWEQEARTRALAPEGELYWSHAEAWLADQLGRSPR